MYVHVMVVISRIPLNSGTPNDFTSHLTVTILTQRSGAGQGVNTDMNHLLEHKCSLLITTHVKIVQYL